MNKLVPIDGHSILNRAFYEAPEFTNSEGLHTSVAYGFLNVMSKILEEEKAGHLVVALDLKESTFRHKMFGAYESTRKPMPEELQEQVPLMKEVLAVMEIPIMTMAGYEADDTLGTLMKRCATDGVEVSVISGDGDLLRLADTHIKARIPKTSRGTTEMKDYYPEDVKQKYQVAPTELIDVKVLMGDAPDNILGVPFIGEKTATTLVVDYGNIENAYAHLSEVKPPRAQRALEEHYDMAQMSKEFATICIDCPILFSYEDTEIGNLYAKEVYQFMKCLGFRSILIRLDADKVGGTDVEQYFCVIDDFGQAEKLFNLVLKGKKSTLGLQLIMEAGTKKPESGKIGASTRGLSVCVGEKTCTCVTAGGLIAPDYLVGKAEMLCEDVGLTAALGAKKLLPYLELEADSSLYDTGVAGYPLNPLKDTYDYDDLAQDYLGMIVPSRADLLRKVSVGKALKGGQEKTGICTCYIAYTPWKVAPILESRLEETGTKSLFHDIEMPLIYSLYRMEKAGIKVERDALRKYDEKLKVRIDVLEQEVYGETGGSFNTSSPKQLGEVLFEHLKMPHGKKTKTGYSTAADVLDKLMPDFPLVQRVLDYRQLTKLNPAYVEGLANYTGTDGRVHGTFNQTITAAGRVSSTKSSLQNAPVRMELGRAIRKAFVPEDGYVFVDADYSQIELRILAHISGDRRLTATYWDTQDIHATTASRVFHTPLEEMTPSRRHNAKAMNFGIVYGISAFGLSKGLSISRKEALEYINKYFETYPGVRVLLGNLVAQGKEQGYVFSIFGRRRPIPELKSANFMQRSFGERMVMNSPIQGMVIDVMKIAMIRVDDTLRTAGMKSQTVLQVHGELLVETHRNEVEQVREILTEQVKHTVDLKVSLEVETSTGDTRSDTK